jgi:hypothetical protein
LIEAGASFSKPRAHFIETQVRWTVAAGVNILVTYLLPKQNITEHFSNQPEVLTLKI